MFYNLPSEVKVELINACGTNYPSIEQILDKYSQIIRKLNITDNSNNQNGKEKTKSNVPEVSTFNVTHSKSNNKSRFNKSNRYTNSVERKYNCLFCGSTDHAFWVCDKVNTKE